MIQGHWALVWCYDVLLTSLGDVKLHGGRHGVAGAAGVVPLVSLARVTEGQFALCRLLVGGVGLHLDSSLHVVVDHPVVVVPEDVLGRAGGGVQDAGQRYRRALVNMVLLSSLYIGLRVHHANLNPPRDGPSRGGHLTLIDPSVSVLDKLYLQGSRLDKY